MTDSLAAATHALIRTVDRLDDDRLREPSLLPGWSRAHVVAHLALNAEGLAGSLEGIAREAVVAMYPSQEQRDVDIEELAAAPASALRDRLLASSTRFDEARAMVGEDDAHLAIPRVPGGPAFAARDVPAMRRREVEIHHADLDAGYDHGDWPADFVVEVLDRVVPEWATRASFRVRADDLGRTWECGEDGPLVSGRAADLAWWVTGRGRGGGLSVADGPLPDLGRWR
ncbi:MAG: maleylpyruvate isomerase family mycothiol-dependent enzyme [Marmoricola sp.]